MQRPGQGRDRYTAVRDEPADTILVSLDRGFAQEKEPSCRAHNTNIRKVEKHKFKREIIVEAFK